MGTTGHYSVGISSFPGAQQAVGAECIAGGVAVATFL